MTQQNLKRSVNSNLCRRRKTRMLRVEILGWGARAERNKYPNILEIFALHTGPSWLLIRTLLIFRYRYQLFFIFSTFELYDWIKSFDKITVIPRLSFRNHFLIIILLNTTLRQCLKNCNIFQRACRLVRLRTLKFTPKKSNEIFHKILFLPTGIFFD